MVWVRARRRSRFKREEEKRRRRARIRNAFKKPRPLKGEKRNIYICQLTNMRLIKERKGGWELTVPLVGKRGDGRGLVGPGADEVNGFRGTFVFLF